MDVLLLDDVLFFSEPLDLAPSSDEPIGISIVELLAPYPTGGGGRKVSGAHSGGAIMMLGDEEESSPCCSSSCFSRSLSFNNEQTTDL